jgi:hypothetical protein
MQLFTSVFCTSTKTEMLGSTRARPSTAKMALKNELSAPPYSPGTSTAITPSSNRPVISDLSTAPARSIS